MGEQDVCEKCINKALYKERKYHREKRQEIIDKYSEVEKTGFYKGTDCRHHTKEKLKEYKKLELKEYPAKTKFTIEGHDPDFGGGETEPLSCEICGDYFYTNFQANEECANYLLDEFLNHEFSERLKWKLQIAFGNYEYSEDEAKRILLEIAEKLIIKIEANA